MPAAPESEKERATAGRVAGFIWLASILMLAAAFAMMATTTSVQVDAFGFRGVDALLGLPAATIGVLIVRRRPKNWLGWLFLTAGFLGGGLTAMFTEYAILSHARHGGSLPLTDIVTFIQQSLWVPTLGSVYLAAHLFPTGRLISPRWRFPAAVTIFGTVAFMVPMSLYPGDVAQISKGVQNPYALSKDLADALLNGGSILFLAGIVAAIASLIVRYRRARGGEREQIRWLIPALALVLLTMLANVVAGIASAEGFLVDKVVPILTVVAFMLLLTAAGAAVLRYRLYDIEIIINRAVIVGVIVGFISVVYVAIVAGIGAAVGTSTESNVALPIVATAIVGAAFQPVRVRARKIADRAVYGKRASPVEALAGFAGASSVDDLAERASRLVVEATTVRSATFWQRIGGEVRAIAAFPKTGDAHLAPLRLDGDDLPRLPDATAVYPLEHHGELLGVLGVAVGASETVSRDDDRLVRALAAQASLVLRGLLDAVDLPAGIVTFLMTDIEGSTRLWEEQPDQMAEALSQHDHLIRAKVAEDGGVLVKSRGEGDSTFAVFADPAAAVRAALAIQIEIAARDWPTRRPLKVRASIHTGTAQLRDRDYYGPVINRCARLRAIAHGAQTLVSGATFELSRDALPEGAALRDLGVYMLKDLVDAERVYQLVDHRLPSDFPPLRTTPQLDSV